MRNRDHSAQSARPRPGDTSPIPSRAPRRLGKLWVVIAVVLFSTGLVFRFVWLDRLPGISGDEVAFSVQIAHALRGEPHAYRAPTGTYVTPFTFVSSNLLLRLAPPSFFLLRLPVAVWACVGLVLNAVLYRRWAGNWTEALLGTLLLSTMPLHLTYARCAWEPSFLLTPIALVVYPCLMVADQRASRLDWVLLFCGSALCVWTTFSAIVLVVLAAAILVFGVRREVWLPWLSRRIGQTERRTLGMLWLSGIGLAVLGAAGILSWSVAARAQTADYLTTMGKDLLFDPNWTLRYLLILGDMVSGTRAFEYFAGVRLVPGLYWISIVFFVALVWSAVRLCRSARPSDRFLGTIWVAVPVLMIVTYSRCQMVCTGNERYFWWVVPLFPVSLLRTLTLAAEQRARRPGPAVGITVLAMSTLFLATTWFYYFRALETNRFRLHTYGYYQTGRVEPKAAAAEFIRDKIGSRLDAEVYAEDYFLRAPLQYLLEPDVTFYGWVGDLKSGVQPLQLCLPRGRFLPFPGGLDQPSSHPRFVVGYPERVFLRDILAVLARSHRPYMTNDIMARDGQPLLKIIYVPPG